MGIVHGSVNVGSGNTEEQALQDSHAKENNARKFKSGDPIEGRYLGGEEWYPGKIWRINDDGTCDIAYDDGDVEKGSGKKILE